MSAVHQLTREDLVSILVEPRNALVKQFQRFFAFDGIELVFSEDSLTAVAERGLERETGARGLRSIIEEILLEVQFELPSRRDVKKCVVTKETVEKGLTPTLVTEAAPEEDRGGSAARGVRLSAAATSTATICLWPSAASRKSTRQEHGRSRTVADDRACAMVVGSAGARCPRRSVHVWRSSSAIARALEQPQREQRLELRRARRQARPEGHRTRAGAARLRLSQAPRAQARRGSAPPHAALLAQA